MSEGASLEAAGVRSCGDARPCTVGMSTLVGVPAALEPEAHRLGPEGLPLRSTLPRSKNVLHDLNELNPDFLSSKRRSIKGRAFRNAGNESVAHRDPQSPSCSGRLKKISAIGQAPKIKLKLIASVPALLQVHPLMSRRCQSLLRNPIQNVLNDLNYLNELNSAGGRRSFRIIARRAARGFFSHKR